ncbi:hypothetical protein DB30_00657 [Enhygromyxa salina]|uniref:Uncharacterized protein n=1 Tax=Enhygromyxa salina TaxID=215803 RepID=A0A0C2DFH8_9BACT|nr:hypothetical protein DB30_00657 [Enhygromyxa salina]
MLVSLSPVTHAGPSKDKYPAPKDAKAGEHTGVITSMTVGKDGDILEFYVKISGNVRTERVAGCGSMSAGQPLLNWAFQNNRLVHVFVDAKGCYQNVSMSAP